jgi:hypothetical protein
MTMKKQHKKSLALSTETVRALNEALRNVAGADGSRSCGSCTHYTCATCTNACGGGGSGGVVC